MSNPLLSHPLIEEDFSEEIDHLEKLSAKSRGGGSRVPKGRGINPLYTHIPAAIAGAGVYEFLRRANKDRELGRSIRLQREGSDSSLY